MKFVAGMVAGILALIAIICLVPFLAVGWALFGWLLKIILAGVLAIFGIWALYHFVKDRA